jgi:hypothetical protein
MQQNALYEIRTLTEANTHKNSRSYSSGMSSAVWFLINLPSFWGSEDETYTTTTYKACPFYCVPKHSIHYEKHMI